jgi:hydrogenase nickel incorporation protein HypA/HybF
MHEYSLVQALLERVEREARSRSATAVHRLRLRVGELAGVEPALFESAYAMCREGTLCANAELVLEPVPVRWACGACGREIATGSVLSCSACGAPGRLLAGDEIVLQTIEMEVP